MGTLRCSECGVENPAQTRFCVNCGAEQASICPRCGAPGQAGARFCGECGSPLSTLEASSEEPSETPPSPEEGDLSEERRRVTVLFADLSGYTAIAERLDPEDTKALVDGALKRLSREVIDREGRIDKYIGDNVMAVFGAPVPTRTTPSGR